MATPYHSQMNGQHERKIGTLKQLMSNFFKPRQKNRSDSLPAISAALSGPSDESLGISPYHALY